MSSFNTGDDHHRSFEQNKCSIQCEGTGLPPLDWDFAFRHDLDRTYCHFFFNEDKKRYLKDECIWYSPPRTTAYDDYIFGDCREFCRSKLKQSDMQDLGKRFEVERERYSFERKVPQDINSDSVERDVTQDVSDDNVKGQLPQDIQKAALQPLDKIELLPLREGNTPICFAVANWIQEPTWFECGRCLKVKRIEAVKAIDEKKQWGENNCEELRPAFYCDLCTRKTGIVTYTALSRNDAKYWQHRVRGATVWENIPMQPEDAKLPSFSDFLLQSGLEKTQGGYVRSTADRANDPN